MTSAEGMTAFVPAGDSPRDTATLLLGAARDAGLDDARAVVATQDGFYISDELADALEGQSDEDKTPEESEPSEVEKVENQIDAEDGPVLDPEDGAGPSGEEVADAAIVAPAEENAAASEPKPKTKARPKNTSGNRAEKQNSTKEE